MVSLLVMCVACLAGKALMTFKKSRGKPVKYKLLATGDNQQWKGGLLVVKLDLSELKHKTWPWDIHKNYALLLLVPFADHKFYYSSCLILMRW